MLETIMKKFSIEEKAQAYDEAIERAKNFIENGDERERTIAESIFAGLMEVSEDEMIRKECISIIDAWDKSCRLHGDYCEATPECIAWLEKQGNLMKAIQISNSRIAELVEEKYNLEEKLKKQNEQKPVDKIESKFKKGNVIRRKDGDGLEWTVEDVHKDGYYTIVCADRDDFIQLDDKWELVEQKPAWSEEDEKIKCSLIYLIEEIIKQPLKKYENWEEYIDWLKFLKDRIQLQTKQGWSEEDEKNSLEIKCLIGCYRAGSDEYRLDSWIDSLKDRVQPQPRQEWSEEDKKMFVNIKACLRNANKDYSREVDWLKSIKPKPKNE